MASKKTPAKKPAKKSPAPKKAPANPKKPAAAAKPKAAEVAEELDLADEPGTTTATEEAAEDIDEPQAGDAEEPEAPADEEPEAAEEPEPETPAEEPEAETPAEEPETPAEPETASAKGGKKHDKTDNIEVDPAAGYEVAEMPVAKLKPNKLRVPSPEDVDKMVRSIRKQGLLDPIIITRDGYVVAGNKRLAAYIALKKDTIPARMAVSINSHEPLSMKDRDAQLQAVVSNIQREQMTPVELGRAFAALIKSGTVADGAELAKETGFSTSEISRVTLVYNNGSEKLKAAMAAGEISFNAAHALVSRAKEAAAQDKAIEDIRAATSGKITTAAVNRAKISGTKSSSRGMRPKSTELSREILDSDATGIVMSLRKTGRKQYMVEVRASFEAEGEHLARFDVVKKVQAALLKLDPAKIRAELELCRSRLSD